MYTVNPQEGEKYFFHLRFMHGTEAKSLFNMRTVDGEVCSSLLQACSPRGLLACYAECRRVLRESFVSKFVPVSKVFATILTYCEPADPLSLWNEHKSLFVSDMRLRHRARATVLRNEDNALSYVFLEVKASLKLTETFTLEALELSQRKMTSLL